MFNRLRKLFAIQGYGLLVICMLLVGTGISMTAPYLSLYCTEEFGMSASAFGIFMAISSLSGVVVNSLIAKRSDSGLNRKAIMMFAMISSAFGYTCYLIFHNYFILLAAVSLFSGFGAPTMPQMFAYTQESANSSKSEDKTFAMSTLRSLFSLGFLVGPLGGALILTMTGYKGLFIGTSIIFLTIAALIFLFLNRQKRAQATAQKKTSTVFSAKSKDIRQPFAAFLLLFVVLAINNINTPLFMVNVLHGSHQDVGLVVSVCAGLEIPIMIGLGGIGRKMSNRVLLTYSCFVAVAYCIILGVSSQPWQLVAAQLLQATFVAIVMGNGLSYFNDLLPHSPGMATTVYSNAQTIGRLVGNLAGGIIAQAVGFRYVYWACLLIVLLSLIVLKSMKSEKTPESAGYTHSGHQL